MTPFSGPEVVLVGHSRGGLSARAFLGTSDPIIYPQIPSTTKAAVKALLTTTSPHLGSPLARIYNWLKAHERDQPGPHSADWDVADFLNTSLIVIPIPIPPFTGNPPQITIVKDTLDVRRPVIGDVADGSPALLSLNAQAAVAQLPANIRYGEIIYNKAPLGLIALTPFRYSVIDGFETIIGSIPRLHKLSDNATAFILSPNGTPDSLKGDGLIPEANQHFTTLHGFSGQSITPYVVQEPETVHTEAPSKVSDILFRMGVLAPEWFPP